VESAVLVVGTEPSSPASDAGLIEGDLIYQFNGRPVSSLDEMHRLLLGETIGQKVVLEVIRGTEKLTLTVTPRELGE
jgi:S1-C subfamily serine protease